MIILSENVFNEDELNYLNFFVNNFIAEEIPKTTSEGYRNDYFKQKVFFNDEFNNKIKKIIKEKINFDITITEVWLNKMDINSNINDDFHVDDTDLSLVIYPTKDFDGGELEWKNDKIQSISITPNSILMLNNKIKHRVKKVTKGIRWSFAVFCIKDKIKTIF